MKAMSGCIWLAVLVVAVHVVGTLAGGDYYGGGYGGYGGGYGGYGYNGYGGNYGYGGYDDGGGKSKKYAKLGLAAGLAAGITGGALLGLPLLLGLTGAAGAGMIGKRSVHDNNENIMKAATRDCQARNECIRHVLQRDDGVSHPTAVSRSLVRSSGTLNTSMSESVRLCVKLFPICSSQLAVPIRQQMSVTKSPVLPISSPPSVAKVR